MIRTQIHAHHTSMAELIRQAVEHDAYLAEALEE